jgi:tetratricopeptide (TPR) repeat protein
LRHVPLLTALLFAVHPINTEAVSYISGRSASLMTLFYLAALLSFVIGRTQHKQLYVYAITPLLFVLALAVKETAVTLPFALLLWEASCGGRWRFEFKPQWTSWLVLIFAAVFFLFSDSYLAQMERSAQLNGLQGNLATQLSGFVYLLQQFALPLWLNIDPDLLLLHDLADAIFPLSIILALFGLMIACWRRRPWISFALGWAMLHLIPLYILLPRIDIANERQLYLAAWPLLLALAIELTFLLEGWKWRLVTAGLLITCITLTVSRNQVYQNEVTLWEDTVAKSPNKARAHNNLGYAYLLAQRKQEARRELSVALQLDPQLYQAQYNLRRLDEEIISSP